MCCILWKQTLILWTSLEYFSVRVKSSISMAQAFLAWELLLLQERVRQVERRLERRVLRDSQDPFALPHNEFMDIFRLSPDLAFYLIAELRPALEHQRNNAISPELQVLTVVQFYAQGCYQRSVGNQFQHNMSQASVSRIIHAVTNAINVRLLRRWIKFPMTQQERAVARAKFRDAPQPFEGAIRAVDCSFINIVGPVEHEEAYVNHHGNHALNVQAIVDSDLKILNINARFPGARNDSYIWSNSPIKRAMEFHYNRGERRTWLIGDAGYALEPWLMTPLPHYPEGTQQFEYTQQLCKARNPVERFFGCFKSTWRCCSFQRILMYEPGLAGRIINACAVLHNMRMDHRLPADDFYNADDAGPHQALGLDAQIGDEGVQANNRVGARAVAHRIQKQIMRERFPHFLDGDIQNDINE